MIVFSLVVLMLGSCSQKADNMKNQSEDKNGEDEKVDEVIKTLIADPAKFHFIVDWLTDTKIVFVERDSSNYLLKTFDITTGKIDTLYEETMIIVDVLIHPSKKKYLLHTSDNSSSGTIKIISLEGIVLEEISIASSELAIEWNEVDPSLVLLTAFQKDWSYDVLLYKGEEEDISILPLEDPFPKWLGEQQIVTVNVPEHPLDGGELLLYNYRLGTEEHTGLGNVVHFDTYGDSLLFVQMDEGNADYKIIDPNGTVLSKWSMPAVSNYSEWVFPEISWIADTTIMMPSASKGGQLDNLEEPFKLVRVQGGSQVALLEYDLTGRLHCSPSGEKCLAGYKAEKMIDTIKKEETIWLLVAESE